MTGSRQNQQLYQKTVSLQRTKPQLTELNWTNIDRLEFNPLWTIMFLCVINITGISYCSKRRVNMWYRDISLISYRSNLKDRLDLALSMCDVDQNGFIDKKEMTKIISAIYDLNGETNRKKENAPSRRAEVIIKKFDVSEDNRLSREEFISEFQWSVMC
ncbi:unnamed protein product [Didymodactylos carnosus]|uniref:EF-hand domain-containing protein n=1 Tax=Didymodactylos carnosus TaxID=1234261 RepID=A0A814UGE3_9BILA|nr:unnamed protein product [Didymodactylos carnosus]CAF1327514.1 unnamed protein product [Didymodactylos carnosus]CAF3938920.1 unnamed protein product [Didymodactylos carnosus]CAF4139037.1 unnamed protein product [Didymodactylos carnosus]